MGIDVRPCHIDETKACETELEDYRLILSGTMGISCEMCFQLKTFWQ